MAAKDWGETIQRLAGIDTPLIDIAHHGEASQSSLSSWSRPSGAQNAVTPNTTGDYLFHTDMEVAPWWTLRFEHTQRPQYIIVYNRRAISFQFRAYQLTIEYTPDGEEWSTLHSGIMPFGSDVSGVPLILPINGSLPIKGLRLSLVSNSGDYLHLGRVSIYAARYIDTDEYGELSFVTKRSDGLGERLRGIIKAMFLAKHHGLGFRFEWPLMSSKISANHATGEPEEIFSEEFLRDHLGIDAPFADLEDFHHDRVSPGARSILVKHGNQPAGKDGAHVAPAEGEYAKIFDSIGFSEKMLWAIDEARKADIGDEAIGVHMRAGDIIYGPYRFQHAAIGKTIAYPIAYEIGRRAVAEGKGLVVFGQDQELCRSICEETGAVFAADHHAHLKLDSQQSAIFDIVLMSRCKSVAMGSSGFSATAHWIGEFKKIFPKKMFSERESADIILDHLLFDKKGFLAASGMQVSAAASYAMAFLKDAMTSDERVAVMRLAVDSDPSNDFQKVVLAIEHFHANQIDEARETLSRMFSEAPSRRGCDGSVCKLSRRVHLRGEGTFSHMCPDLISMGRAGLDEAMALVLATADATNDHSLLNEIKEDISSNVAELAALIGARIAP